MKYSDEQLLAFMANDLGEAARMEIADWIGSSTEAQNRIAELQLLEQLFDDGPDFEPPAEMLYAFREKIAEERERAANRFRWYQVAAAIVLLIGGFGIGRLSPDRNRNTAEFTNLKSEIQVLQQGVMMNTLRTHTASERLKVINTIEENGTAPDAKLIGALVHTMNYDDSPNVRTAAVETLGRFIGQEAVRAEIVHSLGEQDNPLVQITMINLLMKAEDRSAIGPIQKLADNKNSPPEVRQTAELALNVLI